MEQNNPDISVARKIQGYVRRHLQEPISASDIAKAAGYSQYHAARRFKAETGESPFDYIRRERLIGAAHALRNGTPKVIDVAFDFVFDSQEGFTRAFSNAFGISPKRYADYPKPEDWLIPYRYLNRQKMKSEEADMNERTAFIFTQIVERPQRKLILKRAQKAADYFAYCEEAGCGSSNSSVPWEILCDIKEALYEPVGLWLPDNMRPEGTGIYAHGVEVPFDYEDNIPEGFDVIELAPCKLLVFQGEPYDDENFEEAVVHSMEQIDKFNPEVYGYKYAAGLAPRMQLEPWGWRGYIEMRPIEAIK